MASIFTKIVNGEIPCHKIAETEDYLAFLDINPRAKGHTLVIPKQETDYVFDLQDDMYVGLMIFAKELSFAIRRAIPCLRVGVAVIGLEVPHCHVHLVPLNTMNDINFSRPALSFSSEEMKRIASEIRNKLLV